MADIHTPQKVNLFFAILVSDVSHLNCVREKIEDKFGKIDIESTILDFTHTNYYKEEMGDEIKRVFFSMKNLIDSASIVEIKKWSNEIEKKISDEKQNIVKRPVNIDPGYVELSKVVLASTKNYFHRIHLKGGIYAEVTLHFKEGTFQSFEWTYPDYKSLEYITFFNKLRKLYKIKLSST